MVALGFQQKLRAMSVAVAVERSLSGAILLTLTLLELGVLACPHRQAELL
jgi:hypothetical protein